LPKARRNPVDVRYLVEAQTPNVGRAGHLLFSGAPIFLGKGRRLKGNIAGDQRRKAEDNSAHSHGQILFSSQGNLFAGKIRTISDFKINEA
jgi:hypothetical protein